jgi:hypothetical protein
MTGCSAAIEAARRYHEAEAACPPLAYGLHRSGGRCRRMGGLRVCGECAGDVRHQDAVLSQRKAPYSAGRAFLVGEQRESRSWHSCASESDF